MADNQKYYYLKLKENFFESESMIMLESMKDGYVYSNILLKLYLRSLKNNGKLMFNDRIPYSPTMIATITRHSVGDVEKALKIFTELALIEMLDNGAIYMLDLQLFIGLSSTEGERKKLTRLKIQEEKTQLKQAKSSANLANGQLTEICPPKIELELDIEKEIEQDIELNKKENKKKKLNTILTNDALLLLLETNFKENDVKQKFKDYADMRAAMGKRFAIRTHATFDSCLSKLRKYASTKQEALDVLDYSIANNYQGLFALKQTSVKSNVSQKDNYGVDWSKYNREE